jgi:hypothetical protein
MAVKAPPGPLFWIPAGILVVCTLVALWVTAAQVKARKMAARYGERIQPAPVVDAPLAEVTLRRGKPVTVGHLTLDLDQNDGSLTVLDAQQRPLARFGGLKKGDERGWQELRMKLLDVDADAVRIATELRPGAPCLGPGTFRALRPGLRVELPGGRALTLVAWDAVKPEAKVKVEAGDRAEELTLTADQERTALGVRAVLRSLALTLE